MAQLREANQDASAGAVDVLGRLVRQMRARWPEVRIILRADSGFAREALMSWCEEETDGQPGAYYVLGLAKNNRLRKKDIHRQVLASVPSGRFVVGAPPSGGSAVLHPRLRADAPWGLNGPLHQFRCFLCGTKPLTRGVEEAARAFPDLSTIRCVGPVCFGYRIERGIPYNGSGALATGECR
ncbi:MAG: transposase [Candidatus Hydrogenedentes bacterium]|nr:transposase [Candidatus Hydrogenedentota bacterium]